MKTYKYINAQRENVKKITNPAQFRKGMKLYTKLNLWVYKLSFGRLMNTAMGGYPICIVSIIGGKTGKQKEIPLIHVPYGDKKILVGSQAGMDRNPAWVYSLRVNPDISITVDGKSQCYTVRQVDDKEKEALWPHLVSIYPGYDEYQARTDRNIPVFLCDPKS